MKPTRLQCLLFVVSFFLTALSVFPQGRQQRLQYPTSGDPVPKILLVQIIRAEDERRYDDDLRKLFSARNANVRARAALAAGRIGNEAAVPDLIKLLETDDEDEVRALAAFALGEIESPLAGDALVASLKSFGEVRARAVEALGKIIAALPKGNEVKAQEWSASVLRALSFEARRRSRPDRQTILLGLTAVLRAKPEGSGPIVAGFLDFADWRIRADAANTLSRLKLNDGNERLRKRLTSDPDPIVRSNAARVLGATEDKPAFDGLLDRALKDLDARVRVSAIRSLALLKDPRAAKPLLGRGAKLVASSQAPGSGRGIVSREENELLEMAAALGRVRQDSKDAHVTSFLKSIRPVQGSRAPEIEIAQARVDAAAYVNQFGEAKAAKRTVQETILLDWRAASSLAQGLGEVATVVPDTSNDNKRLRSRARDLLEALLDYRNSGLNINTLVAVHSEYAIPDVLRAYAAFKPGDLDDVLRKHLKDSDVVIRGTAADLLGELPPDDKNARALIAALPVALADKDLNDAALSILDSLGKQKIASANEAVKTALNSSDHLIRRKAIAVLKANNAGDFSSRIGTVQTRNTAADYERAIDRIGKRVTATVNTTNGSFVIQLLPDEATLNVDNFVLLANRGYFNGITVHRVVPNFVIQDGDPRGDGNGGPGYQIRCEINEMPYGRAAVGMALSGKDTGGSQWFVTHAPQPHLDGGYTVFGNVISGMNTVDNIARGDVIRSIVISETTQRAGRRRQ